MSAFCQHCEELKDEIAFLKRELGLQADADLVSTVHHALRQTRKTNREGRLQSAHFIALLYRAHGRMVSYDALLGTVPGIGGIDREFGLVKVWAHGARKALGHDAIETVWGRGFRMTEIGMKRVAELLGKPSDLIGQNAPAEVVADWERKDAQEGTL